MRLRSGLFAVSVLVVTLSLSPAAGSAWAAGELARIDDALGASGLTVTATVETEEDPCAPGVEIGYQVEEVGIVVEGDLRALRSTSFYGAAPGFRAPAPGEDPQRDWDAEGNYLVWRPVETYHRSGPEVDESLTLFQLLRITPEGGVLAEPSHHPQLARRPAGAARGISRADLVLLALGRGASRFVDAGVGGKSAAGLAAQSARGTLGPAVAGTWNVVLDPDADLLLREASFVGDGASAPSMAVSTRGTVRIGGFTLAEHGTLRLGRSDDAGLEISVSLRRAEIGADPDLLAEVAGRIAAPLPEGAEILDYRTTPIGRHFVGDAAATGEQEPVPVPDPDPEEPCCICIPVNDHFDECGHLAASVRCSSDWCIRNVVTTASCAWLRPAGVDACNIVSPVPIQPEATQTVRLLANGGCPTGGNLVVLATRFRTYDGCWQCQLLGERLHQTACNVESCPAGLDACTKPRGIRRACG